MGDGLRATATSRGTRPIQARTLNSKFGNARIRRRADAPAAPHSDHVGNTCRTALSLAKNKFLSTVTDRDRGWSIRLKLTQKDRIRHRGSDKFRPLTKTRCRIWFWVMDVLVSWKWSSKCGKTQSFLTGSTYRGEALKGRSEGSWRSGRRRSGDVGGGGTVNFLCIPCRAGSLLSTSRARKSFLQAFEDVLCGEELA